MAFAGLPQTSGLVSRVGLPPPTEDATVVKRYRGVRCSLECWPLCVSADPVFAFRLVLSRLQQQTSQSCACGTSPITTSMVEHAMRTIRRGLLGAVPVSGVRLDACVIWFSCSVVMLLLVIALIQAAKPL